MHRLRELREKAGLTQYKVSKEMKITQGAVSQWETGETFPQTGLLIKLSALYNCSIDDLLQSQSILKQGNSV